MERTVELRPSQLELIERFGVFMERGGTSPVESRIMALLIVCDVTELTFEEIYQLLQISKSAASNAINRLQAINKLDYITKPGDRKRYFKSRLGLWEETFKQNFEKMFAVSALMQEIVNQRPKADKEFNRNLQNFVDFMLFMQKEIPQLYKKWKLGSGK